MLEHNHIWMAEFLHDLEFPVFVALVLINLFYGDHLTRFCDTGLERVMKNVSSYLIDDSEGTISYHAISIVCE